MVAMMRAEIKRVLPEIAIFLQPKCGENRMGYCDEELKAYDAVSLKSIRGLLEKYPVDHVTTLALGPLKKLGRFKGNGRA